MLRLSLVKFFIDQSCQFIFCAQELINLGARTFMVPGNLPLGCNAIYLTLYESKDKKDYDEGGCLKWLNKFAEYYNERLQAELSQLRGLHPNTNIIYADYYNAALPLYHFPTKFGNVNNLSFYHILEDFVRIEFVRVTCQCL